MTNWPLAIAGLLGLVLCVLARMLILYLDAWAAARRETLKLLHRINRNSKRALEHERRIKRRIRLLK